MNNIVRSTLICLAVIPLAHAEDFYLGANVNPGDKGHVRYADDANVMQQRDGKQRDFSVDLFAGYALSPSWALEAGYRGLGRDHLYDLEQGYQLKISTSMGYVAVRNTWRLNDDWALYGKAGVAQGHMNGSISGRNAPPGESMRKTGLYLGVGAEYNVTGNVALQLQLEHTDKLKQDGLSMSMDKVSLGVRVGF